VKSRFDIQPNTEDVRPDVAGRARAILADMHHFDQIVEYVDKLLAARDADRADARLAALKEAEKHLRSRDEWLAASMIDPTSPSSVFYVEPKWLTDANAAAAREVDRGSTEEKK